MTDETAAARCREAISAYMKAFNERDMDALGALLADDVTLVDWEVSATGKAAVLATTEKIVSGAEVSLVTHRVLVDLPHAVADLTVSVDGKPALSVVDLFEFTPDGRIASVRAFRGPDLKGAAPG